MPISDRAVGDRLVLSPLEPLVAGGAAEAFERRLRPVYQAGYRHVIVDLAGVSSIDSAVTILFLLMGLGMSAGLGVFGGAGLGTAFLCVALLMLDCLKRRNHIVFEPREISQSDDVTVKYHTWLDPRISLEDLSLQLMSDGAGVKSVAWEHPKRERV
jgi:hypothetical protein